MQYQNEVNDHCRKYLMHIENKTVQMITFRLADSVPKDVIRKWKEYASQINDQSIRQEEYRKLLLLIDKYEDAGTGECLLKIDEVADVVKHVLLYNNQNMYELICWCIMPNHVHVLIKVNDDYTLSDILFAWRSFSAHAINLLLGRKGKIWMPEYYDRYIRDQEHFMKAYNYILNNPVKAGLVASPYLWRWSSAYKNNE